LLIQSGGSAAILSGGIDVSATIVSAIVNVFAGGTDIGAAVRTGGSLLINSGGTALSATLTGLEDAVSFGIETVLSGGRASNTVVSSGGLLLADDACLRAEPPQRGHADGRRRPACEPRAPRSLHSRKLRRRA
jgi:autotransporter passenger strand-loop-strand repeat protein